VLNPFFIF
jgi:predicted P-type ATPase